MQDQAEQAFNALIEELSPQLPHTGLLPSDVKLTPDDLAIVLAHYGAADLICDALNHASANDRDAIDSIAIRVTMPTDAAVVGCGLAVLTAVQDYATRHVINAVMAHREVSDWQRSLGREEPYWGDIADREKHRPSIFHIPQAM